LATFFSQWSLEICVDRDVPRTAHLSAVLPRSAQRQHNSQLETLRLGRWHLSTTSNRFSYLCAIIVHDDDERVDACENGNPGTCLRESSSLEQCQQTQAWNWSHRQSSFDGRGKMHADLSIRSLDMELRAVVARRHCLHVLLLGHSCLCGSRHSRHWHSYLGHHYGQFRCNLWSYSILRRPASQSNQ
jgi:hypothetical protein